MFGLETQKPRKITTYGKSARQPNYSFNPFLQNSPEKPKSEATVYGSKSKAKVATSQDIGSPTNNPRALSQHAPAKTVDTTWDIPSDDDDQQAAKPTRSQPTKSSILQKPKLAVAGHGKLKENERNPSKASSALTTSDVAIEDAKRKRRREVRPETAVIALDKPSKERDIYDISSEDEAGLQLRREAKANTYRSPVLVKSKPQPQHTPMKSSATTNTIASRTRSRTSTPEPQFQRQTPLTARKLDQDMGIYDFPDDDDLRVKPNPVAVGSPLPSRKRQKTPARETRDDGRVTAKVIAKVKVRRKTPEPSNFKSPARAISRSTTPKLANGRKKNVTISKNVATNGVIKRKLAKGSSAPASLFSMIREPPSPPTDSSVSVASPGSPATPEMSSEMDLDPTPFTPPGQASASLTNVMGSITPRQKQLWGQLLGDGSTESPGDLSLSKLRLSSTVKASKKIASLTRSASDVPTTTHSRRPRLIDSLKASTPIVEEDEMDLDEQTEIATETVNSESNEPPQLRGEISFKKTTSTKVTYGQGRTYLEEKDEAKIWEMFAEPEPSQTTSGFGSQSQGADVDDTEMENQTQLRAAHDLRAAGSQKRLHDEMSMLVMDLEQTSHSTGIRRSALKDLAEKLMDKDAANCLLESGLDRSFLKSVEKDTDTVFLFLEAAVIFLLLGVDPTSSVLDHIFHSKTFINLLKLLDVGLDLSKVVRDRKNNLSKMTQSIILEFRDALFESNIWGLTKPRTLTPRALGLQCIEMLVRKLRQNGSSSSLLSEATMKKLLDIAQAQISNSSPDLAILELALSALQATTAVPSTSGKAANWPEALTKSFADMLPSILILPDDTAHLCIQLSLRLSVELGNHNPVACDIIGTPAVMSLLLQNANRRYTQLLNGGLEGESFNKALDLTVLTFGLTTNLTESSDSSRLAISSCQRDLHDSIRLFIRGKKRAEDAESLEDTQTNVIYGYLAFTLGNLSRNAELRREVAKSLPGGDLSMVLDAMQEFFRINQMTDKRDFEGEEGNEVFRTFTRRLQAVVEEVRALNR